MPSSEYCVTICNQTRPESMTTFGLSAEVLYRRLELAAQEVALAELGRSLAGGTPVALRVVCQGQISSSGRQRLITCRAEVRREDGALVAARDIPMGSVLLMETRALVEALSGHCNIFLPGERATSVLYANSGEVPELPEFRYILPECDGSVNAREAMLTPVAGTVISQLVALTETAEQRAFAVGVVGPGGVPVVTDILVPPGAAEGAGPATVQFSPEDWAFAQDAAADLGAPFRILGTAHTHPFGLIAASPTDWDLMMWAAGAEGLHVIAANVGGQQPTAAGYRWISGSLQQVNLHIEDATETELVPEDEEAVKSCLG